MSECSKQPLLALPILPTLPILILCCLLGVAGCKVNPKSQTKSFKLKNSSEVFKDRTFPLVDASLENTQVEVGTPQAASDAYLDTLVQCYTDEKNQLITKHAIPVRQVLAALQHDVLKPIGNRVNEQTGLLIAAAGGTAALGATVLSAGGKKFAPRARAIEAFRDIQKTTKLPQTEAFVKSTTQVAADGVAAKNHIHLQALPHTRAGDFSKIKATFLDKKTNKLVSKTIDPTNAKLWNEFIREFPDAAKTMGQMAVEHSPGQLLQIPADGGKTRTLVKRAQNVVIGRTLLNGRKADQIFDYFELAGDGTLSKDPLSRELVTSQNLDKIRAQKTYTQVDLQKVLLADHLKTLPVEEQKAFAAQVKKARGTPGGFHNFGVGLKSFCGGGFKFIACAGATIGTGTALYFGASKVLDTVQNKVGKVTGDKSVSWAEKFSPAAAAQAASQSADIEIDSEKQMVALREALTELGKNNTMPSCEMAPANISDVPADPSDGPVPAAFPGEETTSGTLPNAASSGATH